MSSKFHVWQLVSWSSWSSMDDRRRPASITLTESDEQAAEFTGDTDRQRILFNGTDPNDLRFKVEKVLRYE